MINDKYQNILNSIPIVKIVICGKRQQSYLHTYLQLRDIVKLCEVYDPEEIYAAESNTVINVYKRSQVENLVG